MVTQIADKTTIAAAEVQPTDTLQSAHQSLDQAGDPTPLIQLGGLRGGGQFEAVVDQRVSSYAGVVALVVDAGEISPRIGDERVAALNAAAELVIAIAVAAVHAPDELGSAQIRHDGWSSGSPEADMRSIVHAASGTRFYAYAGEQ